MATAHHPSHSHKLPLGGSAVLVWLPDGEAPHEGSFAPGPALASRDGPERWLVLREAIAYARTHPHEGRRPWIKAGDRVLGPQEIGAA